MFQNLRNLFVANYENITYKTSQYPQNIFAKKGSLQSGLNVSESRYYRNFSTDTVLMSWTQRLALSRPWSTVDTRE